MNTTTTKVVIVGAAGRMGRTLVQTCAASDDCRLAGAVEQRGSPFLGQDAGLLAGTGKLDVLVGDDLGVALRGADLLIDFTLPEVTMANTAACVHAGVAMVIGTTGLDQSQRDELQRAAAHIAIVHAPNMSIGVNLSFHLLKIAAQALGDDVDIEIIEAHHRHKVDAPSGTALRMGEIIAAALGRDLNDVAVYGRQGRTGERQRPTIGFETIRGGDIVGEHTVMFAAEGERLELTHRSSSRLNFANGALRAARWLRQKSVGLYDMQDVLGLNS